MAKQTLLAAKTRLKKSVNLYHTTKKLTAKQTQVMAKPNEHTAQQRNSQQNKLLITLGK